MQTDKATIAAEMLAASRLPTLGVTLGMTLLGGNLLVALSVTAVGARQIDSGQSDRSVIEQALIERACSAAGTPGQPGSAAYDQCLAAQLDALRADFGRDLTRLSTADRRKIDSECSRLQSGQGREAYLDCLGAQLAAVRNRRNRGRAAPPEETLPPAPSLSATSPSPSPALSPPRALWRSPALWIATVLASVGLTAGVLVAIKTRKPRATKCRICGAEVPERGELCPKCRHETAEAIRRSAAGREEQLLAQEQLRTQKEDEERSRLQKSREDEEARLKREEEATRLEEARQRESEAAREQQASRPPEGSQDVFDPYAVLGVSRDASAEEIDHAYSKAKLKYDLDQVAGFGNELQDHYKMKAQAVERAYQMLRQ